MFVHVKTLGGSDNDQVKYCEEHHSNAHLRSINSYDDNRYDALGQYCTFSSG